jgi:hypothetical protein
MQYEYSVGQSVNVDKGKHKGTIVGAGMYQRFDFLTPYLLIELSVGYYDPKGGYVSILVAHPDNVKPV